MADFTVELNRDQGDEVSITVDKISPNGLAFTYAFDQANLSRVSANESEFTNEPEYLEDLLVNILKSWRNQQLNDGVVDAYKNANEATRLTVRTTLGL